MKTIMTRLAIAALAATVAASAAHAAPLSAYDDDLPILVDPHYEIKDPIGPVSGGWTWAEKVEFEGLTKVPQYRLPPALDPRNEPKRTIGF